MRNDKSLWRFWRRGRFQYLEGTNYSRQNLSVTSLGFFFFWWLMLRIENFLRFNMTTIMGTSCVLDNRIFRFIERLPFNYIPQKKLQSFTYYIYYYIYICFNYLYSANLPELLNCIYFLKLLIPRRYFLASFSSYDPMTILMLCEMCGDIFFVFFNVSHFRFFYCIFWCILRRNMCDYCMKFHCIKTIRLNSF